MTRWASAFVAALAALSQRASAITQEEGVAALAEFKDLKAMDYDTILCDTCLIEVDCTWPCELACILDLPVDFVGRTCPVCLEYYGCQGCKFLCPYLETLSPTSMPSFKPTPPQTPYPTIVPSPVPTSKPTDVPTPSPTNAPSYYPTTSPSYTPTPVPTHIPTYGPTPAPTQTPSYPPTPSPFPVPSSAPSYAPTPAPSAAPSGGPSPRPTGKPSYAPSIGPSATPTIAPTPAPEFFIYYSSEDKYLYGYQYLSGTNSLIYEDKYDGDLKCDEVSEMLFWSSSTKGYIKALDLRSDEVYTVLEGVTGVQGLAVDANIGVLYFTEMGTPAIMSVSYNGGNATTIHTFDDKVPYGLDIAPEEQNVWGTGTIYVTAYDQSMGYILAMSMDGLSSDIIYKTGYNSIYGVLVDDKAKMMYWIENRGIANGIYMMYYVEDMDSIMFLQDQEEAFWLMAIFDIDMMFTADYEQGFVYEFALAEDGSIGDTTELISVQEPRCIAYFYGLDKSEGKVSGSGAGQASIAHDTEASAISPESAAPAVKRSAKVANLAAAKKVVDESATSAHSLPSTAAMAVVGLFTAGIVGAAVSFRRMRNGAYSNIPSAEAW